MADSSLFKREKNRTGGWGLKDVPRAIGEIFLLNIPYVSINKEGSRLACEQALMRCDAQRQNEPGTTLSSFSDSFARESLQAKVWPSLTQWEWVASTQAHIFVLFNFSLTGTAK